MSTNVTRKIRRVGRFDWELARKSVLINRPTRLALNFVDYLGFENRYASTRNELNLRAKDLILKLEDFNVPVSYIGIGPQLSQTLPLLGPIPAAESPCQAILTDSLSSVANSATFPRQS